MSEGDIIYVAIVDDDKSVCRSFGRLLRACGYEPVAYASAEAFLEDERPSFDCVILDIQLGGMSGLELRRQLTEAHDETPVFFITAEDNQSIRLQAEECGCSGYFRKSNPGALVIASIESVIQARRLASSGDRGNGTDQV